MKLKKVLSLVMAFAMLLTASTIGAYAFNDVATDADAYEAVMGLSALEILTGYDDGSFKPEGKITRAEFATVIARAMDVATTSKVDTIFDDVKADHWASGNINAAFGAGIVNGTKMVTDALGNVISGTFAPEAEVTYDQAVKMIVCAMGFQEKANSMVPAGVNPYPTAYNMIANQKGITSGVAKSEGGASRATVAMLVWNALPQNIMDRSSYGSEAEYKEFKDQSLLLNNQKAVLLDDVKIASLSLNPEDEQVTLTVEDEDIDDVAWEAGYEKKDFAKVEIGACDLTGLQGLSVKALVDVSGKKKVLLAVFPSASNEVLEIPAELFAGISKDKKRIHYYETATSNTLNKNEKLDDTLAVYNNLVTGKTTVDDLIVDTTADTYASKNPNTIAYRFVDTDANGYFDTLFIDDAASFVVGKVDAEDGVINKGNSTNNVFNSNTKYAAMLKDYDFKLVLDPEDENIAWSLKDTDGKELTVADVAVGDVVTVAMSVDGTITYYDITVAKATTVTGSISQVRDRKNKTYYTIDDKDYLINNNGKLEPGVTGTFSLTADGKIIACELEASARNFATAIKVAKTTGGWDEDVQMQIMALDGTVSKLNFADKVSVYNDNTGDATVYDVEKNASTTATTLNGALVAQPIMYVLNSKGEVKEIYYDAGISKETDGDYKFVSGSSDYQASANRIDGRYFTETTAVVTLDEKTFSAADTSKLYALVSEGALIDEDVYSYRAIMDQNKDMVVIVIENFKVIPAYGSTPLFVTGTATVSVDGSPRDSIIGLLNGEEVEYPMAEEVDVYDMKGKASTVKDTPVSVGDAIQVILNGDTQIASYRHLVDVNTKAGTAKVLVTDDMDGNKAGEAKNPELDKDSNPIANAKVVTLTYNGDYEAKLDKAFWDMDMTGVEVGKANKFGVTVGDAVAMYGYGALGMAHNVKGRSLGMFFGNKQKDAWDNYFDVDIDLDMPIYTVSDTYYDGYEVNEIADIDTWTTDGEDTSSFAGADDVIYVYRFDGETVFQMAFDLLNNNK